MTDEPIEGDHRTRVRRNLFQPAHPSVEPWDLFPWHLGRNKVCDSDVSHSSQALAIDFFGTLKCVDQLTRDLVLASVASMQNLPTEGPWQIYLEWKDPTNLLKETTPTQVDALAVSPCAIILFESKFSEEGGACSQPKARKGKARQCNGNYELQVNPRNGVVSSCALSGKGIRYWEIVPSVMDFDASGSYRKCPFEGQWYQWMRNLTLASEVAKHTAKAAAVVIIYADHAIFPFARKLHSKDWDQFISHVKGGSVLLTVMSYQQMCRLSIAVNPPSVSVLIELERWISKKIEKVALKRL